MKQFKGKVELFSLPILLWYTFIVLAFVDGVGLFENHWITVFVQLKGLLKAYKHLKHLVRSVRCLFGHLNLLNGKNRADKAVTNGNDIIIN